MISAPSNDMVLDPGLNRREPEEYRLKSPLDRRLSFSAISLRIIGPRTGGQI